MSRKWFRKTEKEIMKILEKERNDEGGRRALHNVIADDKQLDKGKALALDRKV